MASSSNPVATPADRIATAFDSRYELREVLGEGGVGVVHKARDLQFDRDVAIKTLKGVVPADSPAASRFVVEARITGQLQHPGIPPAYDLGRLPNGQPFLAMKLVKGETLGVMLREHANPSENLGLFLSIFERIAQAVGYAHARNVIHRDLKPSNIMVGAFGEVQVMDWGLAKSLTAREKESPGMIDPEATANGNTEISTQQTAGTATRTGAILGTPSYMPSEQAAGEIHKVDARSDVFALGAILCEILTRQKPYSGKNAYDLRSQAIHGEMTEAMAALEQCGVDGDLIALCKRCLSVNRDDRPADANEVAQLIASHRELTEVRAQRAKVERGQAEVRIAESKKRSRVVLGSSALLALVLFLGMSASLWQMFRAITAESQAKQHAQQAVAESQAREVARAEAVRQEGIAKDETAAKDRALQAERSAIAAKDRALKQAETNLGFAKKGNEILGSVFDGLDPNTDFGTIADFRNSLKKNLETASVQLQGNTIGDPLDVADLQYRLGLSFKGLGEAERAAALLEKCLQTRKARLGEKDPKTLWCANHLADVHLASGKIAQAKELYSSTLRFRKETLGAEHPDTLVTMSDLAVIHLQEQNLLEAFDLLKETPRLLKEKLGSGHRHTLYALVNLATLHRLAGNWDKSIELFEEAVRTGREHLGAEHPDTLSFVSLLAQAYQAAGKIDLARKLNEETLAVMKAKLGSDHPQTLVCIGRLGECFIASGQTENALRIFEDTFALRRDKLGPDHPDTLTSMNNLGSSYYLVGQRAKAVPLLEETLKRRKAKLGPEHADTLNSLNNLAKVYCDARQGEKAVPLYKDILSVLRSKFPNEHPQFAAQLAQVSLELLNCDQFAAAEELLRESLAIREKTQPDVWATFNTQSMLGEAFLGQQKFSDAEGMLLKGYEGMKSREKTIPPQAAMRIPEAIERLIRYYRSTNKPDDWKKWQTERAKYPPETAPRPRKGK